jgi:uncharacterized protein (TIGR02246 family)
MVEQTTNLSILAEELRWIQDRFAIMDLVANYCYAIDDRDLDKLIGLYTPDGVQGHLDGLRASRGRDELRAYFTQRFDAYGMTFHYPHNHTITIEGPDTASGIVTGHAEMALGGEFWIAAIRYHDRYLREAEGWHFKERMLGYTYYMKLSDFPEGFREGAPRKFYGGLMRPAELPESLPTWKAWDESKRQRASSNE